MILPLLIIGGLVLAGSVAGVGYGVDKIGEGIKDTGEGLESTANATVKLAAVAALAFGFYYLLVRRR